MVAWSVANWVENWAALTAGSMAVKKDAWSVDYWAEHSASSMVVGSVVSSAVD